MVTLFQAGMGITSVFWGISEPVRHYSDRAIQKVGSNTTAAAQLAMRHSFFRWCCTPGGSSLFSLFCAVTASTI